MRKPKFRLDLDFNELKKEDGKLYLLFKISEDRLSEFMEISHEFEQKNHALGIALPFTELQYLVSKCNNVNEIAFVSMSDALNKG